MSRLPVRALTVFSSPGARTSQEDHVMALKERGIFAVADGFGGPSSGLDAARSACDAIRTFLEKEAGDLEATLPFVLRSYYSLAGNVLFNALVHANRKLMGLNRGKGVHEKGGASVLAAFLDGNLLAIANIGGCTATLFRQGESVDLTIPRTYARLRDPFGTSATTVSDELRVPLTALGISEDLEPEIVECQVRSGDWLLLYTDGLEEGLKDEMFRLHRSGRAPTAAAEAATQALKDAKPLENVAFSLVIF
jgi:serine/threonine protein phosphatase PrpC